MLNWAALTFGQRLLGLLMASLFMLGIIVGVRYADSLPAFAGLVGIAMIGAAAVMNPTSYQRNQMRLADIPAVCIRLFSAGVVLNLLSTVFLRT